MKPTIFVPVIARCLAGLPCAKIQLDTKQRARAAHDLAKQGQDAIPEARCRM